MFKYGADLGKDKMTYLVKTQEVYKDGNIQTYNGMVSQFNGFKNFMNCQSCCCPCNPMGTRHTLTKKFKMTNASPNKNIK